MSFEISIPLISPFFVISEGNQVLRIPHTLLIFSLQKLQVFTVSQIPLQFHCIFYRQPTVNIFLQFLHSIFALFVCKKCSETAVGFVHSEKPVLPLQILAVLYANTCPYSTILRFTMQYPKVNINKHTMIHNTFPHRLLNPNTKTRDPLTKIH